MMYTLGQNTLNLHITTEPVTAGADVRLLFQCIRFRNRTLFSIAYTPAVTALVSMQKFRCLGQCRVCTVQQVSIPCRYYICTLYRHLRQEYAHVYVDCRCTDQFCCTTQTK